tara:strand:+ start:320 stop:541 length:222 start_codon:yes stop_codon:yes gene_type:complete
VVGCDPARDANEISCLAIYISWYFAFFVLPPQAPSQKTLAAAPHQLPIPGHQQSISETNAETCCFSKGIAIHG